VAGCRGTADQRCTVIYEELAEGQLRGLEPLALALEKCRVSCIKAEMTVRESTRNDVAPPAETMTVVDAVNVSQVVLFPGQPPVLGR